jgi:acylaminoacyl-peptidase
MRTGDFHVFGRYILVALLSLPLCARAFTAEDFWDWRTANDAQISADGASVIFEEHWWSRDSDREYSNLRLVSRDGKNLRPLTNGPWRDTGAHWSPDGTRVAWISDRNGSVQIYVGRRDGEAVALTHLEQAPSGIAWSPDGASIAFLAAVETHPQLFVIAVQGGAPRQLTNDSAERRGAPAWMPDGRSVLCSWPTDPLQGDEIYSIRLADGAVRRLTDHPGPDEQPVPSPDGSKIAYISHDYRQQTYAIHKIYVMNADGSRIRILSGALDRDAGQPHWSSDSRTVYFLADDRGSTHIYAARQDGTVRQVTREAGRFRAFSLADDGTAAMVNSSRSAPSEVITAPVDVPAKPVRLVSLNDSLLAGREWGSTERIDFGAGVEGWLTRPPQFDQSRKYPLLLDILDGPGGMYGDEFNLRAQYFASRGFLVLCVNPRGSAGYGEQFGNLLPTRFPGDDYEDLMHAVDALVARDYVDAKRLVVAGGTVAAWALGHTERFAAAVVRQPVTDWALDVATQPDGAYRAAMWMKAMPWEKPEQYAQRSPISYAQSFKTPTLILAGESDPESDLLSFALRVRKVQSELIRLPAAGRPSERIAELEATAAWLERFVK